VPQLLAPMVVDQFDNAQHVEALRLGVSVPMKDYQEKIVTAKLTSLLGETGDGTRRACSRFAARFARENALDNICDIVESLG
jgi:UDP:flavonoid glycosyltransferase YjiC (YdhE family)